jgi:hypothetical protein
MTSILNRVFQKSLSLKSPARRQPIEDAQTWGSKLPSEMPKASKRHTVVLSCKSAENVVNDS